MSKGKKTDKMNEKKNSQLPARKWSRGKSEENENIASPVEKPKKVSKCLDEIAERSVKRKIDFSNDAKQNDKVRNLKSNQVNNNATVKVNEQPMNLRNRNLDLTVKIGQNVSDSRVQWTKEFLEKIKRSNERNKQ